MGVYMCVYIHQVVLEWSLRNPKELSQNVSNMHLKIVILKSLPRDEYILTSLILNSI